MAIRLLTILFIALLFPGCSPRIKISKVIRATPELEAIQFEKKGIYSKPVIRYFVKKIKTPDAIEITSGIDLYRVSYFTADENNKEILVSGLLAFPRNKKIKGMVSYHHGTNSERNNAPSRPSPDEGLAIAAIFAGGGYLCLVPDYIGFGVSNEVHTYLHAATTVNAVVDLIKLGSRICSSLTGKETNDLFLVGVSQGGHTTAAVHRYLEQNPVKGLNLVASSSIAGAYNLREISIPYAIEKNSVFYLGYLANSYCHIYNRPIGSLVVAPYDTAISKLFDGNHSYEQIKGRLPKTASGLFTRETLTAIVMGQKDWFTEKLEENRTDNWKPVAPFRIYYGSKDNDVSPNDALQAYNLMKQLGGNVQLVGVGDLNHLQTAYSALPKSRAYFDSLTVLRQNRIGNQ
jgi:pimeloyl-ACP methyl ester carboxylesterase